MQNVTKKGKFSPVPLSLFRIRDYTGYQLYAKVQYKKQTSDVCMQYCIATVLEWLRNKIPDKVYPDQVIMPSPEEAAHMDGFQAHSCHYSKGYSFDITSLLDEDIWALNVHEPDSNREDRPGVVGRTIVTDIALHKADEKYVELGIRTTILDPMSVPELPSTFRPAIVRTLLLAENIELVHVQRLKYCKVHTINTPEDMRRFVQNVSDPCQCLPSVLFTYERKSIRETITTAEEEMNLNGKSGALQALISRINAENIFDEALPSLPYDVEEFAHQTYGYGWTYLISDEMLEKANSYFDFSVCPGDVILVEPTYLEPKLFTGEPQLFPYRKYQTREDRNALFDKLMNYILHYSKRKQIDYHGVVFERQARNRENERIIAQATKKGKGEMESSLSDLFDTLTLDNNRLQTENGELAKENSRLNSKIDHMKHAYDQAKGIQNSLEALRSIGQLPKSNMDVAKFFKAVFSDRIDFTERGIKSVAKCEMQPSSLWEALYTIVLDLVDMYRSNSISDIEHAFLQKTGLSLSLHEGKNTHKDIKLDRMRDDEYNGKTISIEPHVKLKSLKGDPDCQRIYYAFDAESGKIIIGHIGEHLRNASSRDAK